MSKTGGAVVLVSTLVVAWWLFFGDLGEDDVMAGAPVPMPLRVSPAPAPAPAFDGVEPPAPSTFPAAERQRDERLLDIDRVAGLDHQGLPRAWVVRVGAFADSEQANALLSRLLEDRYPAYSYSEGAGGGAPRHVVVVGPKIDRRRALEVKRRLSAEYRIDSVIEPYNPLKK